MVGVDQNFDLERLALQHLRRRIDRGELHFGLGAPRQRNRKHLHFAAQRKRGLKRIARGGIAVRDQHDPRHVKRRNGRRGHLKRGGHVCPFGIEPAWVGLTIGRPARRFLPAGTRCFTTINRLPRDRTRFESSGLCRKRKHCKPVAARVGKCLAQKGFHGLDALFPHALAAIDGKHDEQLAGRANHAQPGKRQDQQHDDQPAQPQRRNPLPPRKSTRLRLK